MNETKDLREEAEESLMFLAATKEEQMKSRHPLMFVDTIKAARRKTLGLYQQLMNKRIPVDIVPTQLTEVI